MMIDTMNYPLTDEYDLNLWQDDEGRVKLTAYKLRWVDGVEGKELATSTYEEFYTLGLKPAEVVALNATEVEDEWTTRSHFHAQVAEWGGVVTHRIQDFLMTLPPYVAENA
jgi:hypothetical protein